MGNLLDATGFTAYFSTTHDGKEIEHSKPLVFWYDGGDGHLAGWVVDDQNGGRMRSAESYSNFKGYSIERSSRVVAAFPAGDLYSVMRDDDGMLHRHPIAALVVYTDGEVGVREIDCDGDSDPTKDASHVGLWDAAWGAEPFKDEPVKAARKARTS